jgi:uncharacterized protein YcnI
MRSLRSRRLAGAITGATLMLVVALPVSAHITTLQTEVPGGGFGTEITFRVPHGCDGAATDTIELQIPEGVTSVKPKWTAGWTIETEPRAAAASMAPGASPVADEPAEVGLVRWSGATLPDDQYMDFSIRAVFPDTPGAVVYLPIVQYCGDTQEAWIEIPAEGQTEDDLELPAPAVTIVESADEGHDH